MGRQLLALVLVLTGATVLCGGCSNGDGPNDPMVKPADQKKTLDTRMSPDEQARHAPPPSGGGKR